MTSIATKKNNGALMALSENQIRGFILGSICPLCKEMKLIYRSWRDDHYCGNCREVFRLSDGKVYHLGHQDQIE